FGVFELSADLSQLSIYIEHDIATPINGHVHYGVPGVEGPVAFGFSSFTSPISETWNLDPDDIDSLLNTGLYVNIHTAAFPAGEIRGQLEKKSIRVSFAMDESQEDLCAGTGSSATGGGQATLKPFGRQLNLSAFHNVPMTIDAHIHSSPVCVNGGIVFPIPSFASPLADIWYLPKSGVIDFFQQELYLNIHSTPFPPGEIRGQFVKCCQGGRGDLNYDGVNTNILDLTYAVDRIFRGGLPAPCFEEGDVNSDGTTINVLDLTFIVDRIFRGGPSAGPCPL
ncbi:MAG: CHRD domain-containing protein, partial [Candidatus Zixiibacteriota bacterium]